MPFRIEKVNSLLVQEISNILNKTRFLGLGFVTVTSAECAKDLKSAKIWISIMDKNKDKTLSILKGHLREIQKELNQRIEIKFCPKIRFYLDKSEDNYFKIDKLLKDEKRDLNP
ncbi:30S ribosome-binding factor RbfA [Patescibacteria group bacterium]|nr:30S ribosome-binding factor RbfA [Patescibacteria group bacterium]